MDCSDFRLRLVDYVLDDIGLSERVAIGVHTARCYACREELAEMRRLLALAEQAVQHPNPQSGEEKLWALIRRREAEQFEHTLLRRWRIRIWAARAAAAAIVLLTVGVTAPFIRHYGPVRRDEGRTESTKRDFGKLGSYSLSEALSERGNVIREEHLLASAKDHEQNHRSDGEEVKRL